MNIRFTWLIFLSVLAFSSCKKESPQPVIPEVYVNFFISPNSTEFLELNAPGGWVTVTGGYRGILIYRLTMDEFLAYERTCPWDPFEEGARIDVDESGTTSMCPVCGSKYIVLDGSPFEGPSTYLLKPYHTNYDGNLLFVYN
ncbi:hypothetical protein ACFLS7_01250 [Bacteroidota bacterium]